MKSAKMVWAIGVVLCSCLIAIPAFAAEKVVKKGNRYTVYNTTEKCQMVCKGPKPVLAYLEDGLAYALDLPLAILSPLACPIISPVLDRLDPVEKRSYIRAKR
jgi:hypothetical protein